MAAHSPGPALGAGTLTDCVDEGRGRRCMRDEVHSAFSCNIAGNIVYNGLVRLVLDTATVVAAIRSDAGASRRLLRAAVERRRGITLLVSVPLLIEYEAVMTRIEHLKAARL